MALTDITIDFDLAQILGSDFDPRRTKAYVTTNVESGTLMDTTTGETRLGDEAVTIAADGTGSFTTWATGADGNPISWQTSLVVDYPRTGQRDRKRRVFGPWTLTTADAGKNIVELEDEQAVPAEYQTAFTASMETIRDESAANLAQQELVSGLTGEDDAVALLVNTPTSDTAVALSATYVAATVATGAGIDPTGVADSTAALQALVDDVPTGGALILPPGIYKTSSPLTIAKSMFFGGSFGGSRWNHDYSNQIGGVEFTYVGTTGEFLSVAAPTPNGSGDEGCIAPHLAHFHVRSNKNVVGAVSGGGITLDGHPTDATAQAIRGFVVEQVSVSEAKGDGFTITGDVYEGRVVGLSSFRCGGKGVNVGAAIQPGEILWEDIHTNNNVGDGAYLLGPGNHQIVRWSSSRNGGAGIHFKNCVPAVVGLQCETTAGSEIVIVENCNNSVIIGLNIDYTEPTYTGTGLAIKGTSEGTTVIAPEFSGTATTWDITTEATTKYTRVTNYRGSAVDKVSFAGVDDVLFAGGAVVKGTLEVRSDSTSRVPSRVKAFTGQTGDLTQWTNSAGSALARVTSGGSFRSADDIIAKLGAASQVTVGAASTGKGGLLLGTSNDTNLYRDAADTLKTDDKLITAGYATAYVAKTAAYTLTSLDHTVDGDATGGAFSLTLPTAVGRDGQVYLLRKKDASANAVTVATTSAQTINGAATYSLAARYDKVRVQSDGANWMVV